MTELQATLLRKIAVAVVDSVREMGAQGAPAGPLYAALMSTGMTLEQFQRIMDSLVNAKLLRHSGHVYYYVGK